MVNNMAHNVFERTQWVEVVTNALYKFIKLSNYFTKFHQNPFIIFLSDSAHRQTDRQTDNRQIAKQATAIAETSAV